MPFPAFTLIPCETAKSLWDLLSPEKPLAPAPADQFIYRGQSDADFSLGPAALRPGCVIRKFFSGALTAEMQIYGEMRLLQVFVGFCDQLGLSVPNDSPELRSRLNINSMRGGLFIREPSWWPTADLIGLMALAQHHRVPTRLLDWTRRAYVAAYFAASQAMAKRDEWRPDQQIAVWALEISRLVGLGPDDDSYAYSGLYPRVKLVTAPGSVSSNVAAQGALFTLLKERGSRGEPLQTRTLEEEFTSLGSTPLWKLTLPATQAPEILDLCEKFGITAATMFPTYDGVGAAVNEAARSWKPLPEGKSG